MKKTIYAGLLLATLGITNVNAKSFNRPTIPETAQFFCYKTCSETKTEGNCKVTYRVTTKYFLCCVISVRRCEVSRTCSGGTDGGQTP